MADNGVTIEPVTNYGTLRMQDFRGGQSAIGFMGTAVNRASDLATDDVFHSHAYVGALDFRHKIMKGMYEPSGYSSQLGRRHSR